MNYCLYVTISSIARSNISPSLKILTNFNNWQKWLAINVKDWIPLCIRSQKIAKWKVWRVVWGTLYHKMLMWHTLSINGKLVQGTIFTIFWRPPKLVFPIFLFYLDLFWSPSLYLLLCISLHLDLSSLILFYPWLYLAISDYLWLSLAIFGNLC